MALKVTLLIFCWYKRASWGGFIGNVFPVLYALLSMGRHAMQCHGKEAWHLNRQSYSCLGETLRTIVTDGNRNNGEMLVVFSTLPKLMGVCYCFPKQHFQDKILILHYVAVSKRQIGYYSGINSSGIFFACAVFFQLLTIIMMMKQGNCWSDHQPFVKQLIFGLMTTVHLAFYICFSLIPRNHCYLYTVCIGVLPFTYWNTNFKVLP